MFSDAPGCQISIFSFQGSPVGCVQPYNDYTKQFLFVNTFFYFFIIFFFLCISNKNKSFLSCFFCFPLKYFFFTNNYKSVVRELSWQIYYTICNHIIQRVMLSYCSAGSIKKVVCGRKNGMSFCRPKFEWMIWYHAH